MGLFTKQGRQALYDGRFLHVNSPETVWALAPLVTAPGADGTGWALPASDKWSNWNDSSKIQFQPSNLSLNADANLLTLNKATEFGAAVVSGQSPTIIGIGMFNASLTICYGYHVFATPVVVNSGDTTRVASGGFQIAIS